MADSIDSFVAALFISIVVTAFEFFSYNHFTDAASFAGKVKSLEVPG